MRGISTSSVTTSGFICSILLSAKSPSMAVAITSISLSRASRFEISLRMTAESSTTMTLTLFVSTCISPFAFSLQSFKSYGLAQDIFSVEDEDDLAVADQRRAGDGVVVQPLVVERLDDDFLFAIERVGEDAESLSGNRDEDHKQPLRFRAQCRACAAAPPLEVERPARTDDRDEAVAQSVTFHTIDVGDL